MDTQPEAGPSKPKPLTLKIRLSLKPPAHVIAPNPDQPLAGEHEPIPSPSPATTTEDRPLPKIRLKTKLGVEIKPKPLTASAIPYNPVVKKPPKPKSLTEVLTKILTKLKKKDDFGFFLQPVDIKLVPNYLDVITSPMDFGTIGTKISKGQYRSLDQFNADFRLVVNNAKKFNGPQTVFHREAVKIELIGMDLIAQAAAQVVENDTPLPPSPNIDESVEDEQDERESNAKADDEDAEMQELPSSHSNQFIKPDPYRVHYTHQYQPKGRGPYRKTVLKEEPIVGPGGELPGSRYGVGCYPPGSDFAKIALALEIRGKRYRTKKEKLKIEKEGPPTLADGSLDYSQFEDPFAVLSHFATETFDIPVVEAIKPNLASSGNSNDFAVAIDPQDFAKHIDKLLESSSKQSKPFFLTRGALSTRAAAPEPDNLDLGFYTEATPPSRVTTAADFGVLSALPSKDEAMKDVIKQEVKGLDRSDNSRNLAAMARDGVDYLRTTVYGGVEGLAYTRSVMDFVRGACNSISTNPEPAEGEEWGGLGMSLEEYVRTKVLLPVTAGYHGTLEAAHHQIEAYPPLRKVPSVNPSSPNFHATAASRPYFPERDLGAVISEQIMFSREKVPALRDRLSEIVQLRQERIDLTTLITSPNDLLVNTSEWDPDANMETSSSTPPTSTDTPSGEWIRHALVSAGNRIVQLSEAGPEIKMEEDGGDKNSMNGATRGQQESPELRALRLNLLALAKLAPLHQITSGVARNPDGPRGESVLSKA